MMTSKRTTILIFATIVTVVLAAIAVVTSLKLKEVATVPIAPNVPVSKPKAVDYVCQTTFTVTDVVTPVCQSACSVDTDCPSGLSCSGNKCVNPTCPSESDCACPDSTPTPTPTSTPTPTPTPDTRTCNITCNPNSSDTGCPSGLTCEPNSRRCRNPQCPEKEDCTCSVNACNKECNPNVSANDSGCTGGLVCEPNSRRCRNASCTGSESCSCSTATATPIPTTIPKAGNTTPGILFLFTGGILVILGMTAVMML